MAGFLAAFSPASLLVTLLMLLAGGVLYAAPSRRYRTLGQAGLVLGAALATARYLDWPHALVVGAAGLLLTWLLDGLDAAPVDPIGTPMRLLLAAFAAVAASALMAGRPLGAPEALDANATWYWTGALGLLLLLSERGTFAVARGGALSVGAIALATLHLLPEPAAVALAATAVALGVGAAAWWLAAGAPLPGGRRGMLGDALLALAAAAVVVAAAPWLLQDGVAPLSLRGGDLPAAAAALLLGCGVAVHVRLTGLPGATGTAWAALSAALLAVLSLAAPEPGLAGLLASGVPLAGLLALGGVRGADGAPKPLPVARIVLAAAAAACAGAVVLIDASRLGEPEPALARVGLALVLVHMAFLGAIAPGHLWALGLAGRGGTSALAAAAGLGSLAGLALLGESVESYPWLLGVVGARPLVVAVGLAALGLGAIVVLAETEPERQALHLASISGGVALLALGSGAGLGPEVAHLVLTDRAFALGLALLGADAFARWSPGRRSPLARRLLRPAVLPLWAGLLGLAGLPPTLGFVVRWSGLAAIGEHRPDLIVVSVLAAAVGVLGLKRVGDRLVADPAEREPSAPSPPAWRLAAPLGLAGLYLVLSVAYPLLSLYLGSPVEAAPLAPGATP